MARTHSEASHRRSTYFQQSDISSSTRISPKPFLRDKHARERQPLADKNKTDPGNLGKSLDLVYQSGGTFEGCLTMKRSETRGTTICIINP
ncbi:hypothetical protein T265_06138 [Opisthorchis viverrini]|uniref:Uncharacterized protein n=1 Tax=Opisthorchis viverrini TaxID=6198 RepID=A0A074ZHD7_OPIVI|nr:hypothetical protein T265_06138 [Opisthorchis viverrini]KER26633.1 hypothetical protein T265_06138 [Opisthorchis viverrini]